MKQYRHSGRHGHVSLALLSLCLGSLSSVAFAGRDASQMDMQDRAYKQVIQEAAAKKAEAAQAALPLDHGPHAVATPWANELLRQRRAADSSSTEPKALAAKE